MAADEHEARHVNLIEPVDRAPPAQDGHASGQRIDTEDRIGEHRLHVGPRETV